MASGAAAGSLALTGHVARPVTPSKTLSRWRYQERGRAGPVLCALHLRTSDPGRGAQKNETAAARPLHHKRYQPGLRSESG